MKTEDIWNTFSSRLLAYIKKRVEPEEADDILQNIFLKIHQRKGQLRNNASLPAWLFQIARNEINDFYRKRGRNEAPNFDADEGGNLLPEMNKCLQPLLNKLPPADRELIQKVDLLGQKQVDLAEELGIPYPSLKSKLQRSRKKLRSIFFDCCIYDYDSSGRVMSMTPANGSRGCDDSC